MNPGMKMMLMNEATGRNRDNRYNGTYNVDIGTYNGGSEMRRRRDSRGRYMENDNDTEMRGYRDEGSEMRRGGYRNESAGYGNEANEMRRRGGYRNESTGEMGMAEMNGYGESDMRRQRNRSMEEAEGGTEVRGGYRNEMDGSMENEMRRGRSYYQGDNRTYNAGNNYRNEGGRMKYEGNMPESRFRDRRGREHYDNGRFAPMRSMMEDEDEDPQAVAYPYFPPYMPRYERRMIGFGDDTMMLAEPRQKERMQQGMSQGEHMDLDQVTAEQWMRSLPKEDGSKGPHWTKEQVKQYMGQVGYTGAEHKFWSIMNALYSDFSKVAKKYGVDRPEYFADLTKAWLEDKDAWPEKAGLYYRFIVKH